MGYKSYRYYDDKIMDGHITLWVWEKSKKDNWWCRISIPNKTGYVVTNKSLKTTSKAEAIVIARQIYLRECAKHQSGHQTGTMAWNDYFAKYIKRFQPTDTINSTSGQLRDDWINEKYYSKFFKRRTIESISDQDILDYLDWRIGYWANEGAKEIGKNRVYNTVERPHRNTMRREVRVLHRIWEMATKEGRVTWDFPSREIRLRMNKLDSRSTRGRFSPYEGTRDHADWVALKKELYARRVRFRTKQADSRGRVKGYVPAVIVANERLICFMLVMVNVGMRPAELLSLKWEDVRVRTEKERIDGVKIEYTYTLYDISAKVSKTNRARTAVAANGHYSWRHIQDWKAVCEEFGYPTGKGDLLFAGHHDKSKPTDLAAYFRKVLIDLGLHDDINGNKRTLYSFRHLFIEYAVLENRPIKAVRDNCGTSLRMLNDYYLSNNAWGMRHYLIRKGFYERAIEAERNKTIRLEIKGDE